MTILMKNFGMVCPGSPWDGQSGLYMSVDAPYITYVGSKRPVGHFDREIDCAGKLMMPGLYNCHTHAAMTLFRGYGEDLPLQQWLDTKIFPAEDLLTNEAVYAASQWAIAEMLRAGVVAFSDMYFFCDMTAKAVAESGIKANISRSVVSFDPNTDWNTDRRFQEARELFESWHNAEDGRIKIDMALHAEYTNVPSACRALGDYAAKVGTGLHIHLSETEAEHQACKERYGKTPAEFFADCGCFDLPVTAAHCVWVEDRDISLMAEKHVTAVHNPTSNLKLGSGIMPLKKLLDGGVRVTLGTDGAASNNTLDVLKEANLAALLQKGTDRDTVSIKAPEIIRMATSAGAVMQRREDCGILESGKRADLILLDLDEIHNRPFYDLTYAALYSCRSSDVCLTMADGRILYENGGYSTLDMEKLRYDMRHVCENYFRTNK